MSNFHHIMAESKRKTAFIKSFPVFKLILESARIKSRKFRRKHIILGKSKYDELVEKFEKDLLKGLSPKEVEMLKSLYEIVPPNATILFFDFLKYPVVGYNLERIPELFKKPGWLFHATTDHAITAASKTGYILSPVELIREQKHYWSSQVSGDERNVERISYGISFALQDHSFQYQVYMRRNDEEDNNTKVGHGGFFIFPMEKVLKEELILQIGGLDHFPEINLIDPTFDAGWGKIYHKLLSLHQRFNEFRKRFDDVLNLFKICKKNIEKIEAVVNYQESDKTITHYEDDMVYVIPQSLKSLSLMEDNLVKEMIDKEEGSYERFMREWNQLKTGSEREKECRKKHIEYSKRVSHDYYSSNSIIFGSDAFFQGLRFFFSDKYRMKAMYHFLIEDNFFGFFMVMMSEHDYAQYKTDDDFEKRIMPTWSRYAPGKDPAYLNDTIFHYNLDYLDPFKSLDEEAGKFMIAQMERKMKSISQDALHKCFKLSPKRFKRLMSDTDREVIRSIEILGKKEKTDVKNRVNINNGVLFLPLSFQSKDNEKVIKQIAKRGVPLLCNLKSDRNGNMSPEEALKIIQLFFGCPELPILPEYKDERYSDKHYFYCKDVLGQKQIFYRNTATGEEKRVI